MSNPVLVFDDACGFCTWWADFVDAHSPVEVVGFSVLAEPQLERLPSGYKSCAHLLTEDEVRSCGAAVEAALCKLDVVPAAWERAGPIRQHPSYAWLRERFYRWVAANRDRLGWVLSKPAPASTEET